jgi:hypothetical protein
MAYVDPLNGVFPGDSRAGHIQTVSQILRAAGATVAERREQVGGMMCYVVEAKVPTGRYTVWMDPEHSYHVAAAECRRTGDDLYAVRLVPDLPRGPWLEHRFSLRDVKFRQVGGHWVPVRADDLSENRYEEDDQRGAIMGTVERTGVELGVDFDAAGTFKPDFPDGTPVTSLCDDELVANRRRDL